MKKLLLLLTDIVSGILPPGSLNQWIDNLGNNFQDDLGQNIVFRVVETNLPLWINDAGDNFVTESADRIVFNR